MALIPLDPIIELRLSHGLTLQATHRDGPERIRVALYNGTVLTIDTISPSSKQSRQRFIAAARKAEPILSEEELERALLALAEDQAPRRAPQQSTAAPAIAALEEQAGDLLTAPDLLRRYRQTVQRLGLVGEERNALLLLLAAVARISPEPISVVVKGPSSAGKSFLLTTVLKTLCGEAYLDYTTISPHFLNYDTAPIAHRIVVLMEAPGLAHSATSDGDTTAYVARSLLSEGCIRTGTVERGDSGLEAKTIVRPGPAALWTTTTRSKLDEELETRLLSLSIRDDPEQTARIIAATAARYDASAAPTPDLPAWHALHALLQQHAPMHVRIPYSQTLGELMEKRQVRARRDFSKLLALIGASAILHHHQRQRDIDGCIIADVADYYYVHAVAASLFQATAAEGCTPAVREAVQAVAALTGELSSAVTVRQVAERLQLDRSAAQRRCAVALGQGWLVDEGGGERGRQHLLRVGDPLPEERPAIPRPEVIAAQHPEWATAVWVDPFSDDAEGCLSPCGNDCTTAQLFVQQAMKPATPSGVVHDPTHTTAQTSELRSVPALCATPCTTCDGGRAVDTAILESCAVVHGKRGGKEATPTNGDGEGQSPPPLRRVQLEF